MRGLNLSFGRGGRLLTLLGGGLLLASASCNTGLDGSPGATGLPGPTGMVGPAGGAGAAGQDAILPAGVWVDSLNNTTQTLTRDGLFLTNRGGTLGNIPIGAFDDDNAAGVGGCSTNPNTRRGNRQFVGFSTYDKQPVNGAADSLTSVVIHARLNRGVGTNVGVQLLLDCDANGTIDEVAFADSTTGVTGLPMPTGPAADVTFAASAAIWKGLVGSATCSLNTAAGAGKALTGLPTGALLVNARPVGASVTAVCEYPKGAVMASILFTQGTAADAAFRETVVESATINYMKAGTATSDLYTFKR